MTWRAHTWEFTVSLFSWVIALGALAFVIVYVAFDSFKTRRKGRW